MNLYRSTDPAADPLTSALVEEKLSFQSGFDSNIVTSLIKEAAYQVEEDTRLSLITQTWTLKLDRFPKREDIYLPMGPVQSVTSVKYINTSGAEITLVADTDYRVSVNSKAKMNRVIPISGWPVDVADVDDYTDAVEVVYVTGYGNAASDVPEWAKGAMYLNIVMEYNNGQLDTTPAYNRKIRKHKDFKDYSLLNK